jgi:hypothetical protein
MDKEIDEIIEDLKNNMQALVDIKTAIDETMLDVRNAIAQCMMLKEAIPDGSGDQL